MAELPSSARLFVRDIRYRLTVRAWSTRQRLHPVGATRESGSPYLSITLRGHADAHPAAARLFDAFRTAECGAVELPPWLLEMRGMAGRKTRALINHLVSLTPDARYLEVGSWAGSTACSALYANEVAVTCIDNWSEFGGPRDEFLGNIERAGGGEDRVTVIEKDFRAVALTPEKPWNIYLFDGPHSARDQRDGVMFAAPVLSDTFTLLVDDWNWPEVRTGTYEAISSLKLDVLGSVEIRTTENSEHAPEPNREQSDWHNGLYVAVCRQRGSG